MVEPLSEEERFDASQYAFFGGNVTHEVELGGLDEEENTGLENDNDRLVGSSEKDEGHILGVGSRLDDASVDISELSSSYRNLQLGMHDADHDRGTHWRSCHYLSNEACDTGPLGYPLQLQRVESEPGFSPTLFSPAVPPLPVHQPRAMQQVEPEPGLPPTSFSPAGAPQPIHPAQAMQFQVPNQRPHVSSPHFVHIGGHQPIYSQYGFDQNFNEPSFQGPWMRPPRTSMVLSPAFMQQQIAEQHLTLPSHLLPHRIIQALPDYGPPPLYNTQSSAPPLIMKSNDYFSTGDLRNNLTPRGRQFRWQLALDHRDASDSSDRHLFRSKYTTAEEIEGITHIQLAAAHDPYIDDCYHEAVQAKLAGATRDQRQFSPSSLRDLSSHTRAPSLSPAFIPVDGMGKVPFSSIRCPQPLLEVDGLGVAKDLLNANPLDRPLKQEPMLAARIAIEDGLCLLLDVDDIDRYLSATNSDNGAYLRHRRQMMLEDFAVSMQLVDSVTGGKQRNELSSNEVGSKDDFVFLHIVSLPKGRKLVSRYFQLLPPGSHLVHIVCKAVFRHLQYLFGVGELSGSPSTPELAKAMANCIDKMNLSTLTSCLAAGVLSQESLPFQPMGASSGDGATIVIKAVLERATKLLVDRSFTFPLDERKLWQATFDKFFVLLYLYCTSKYGSIIHSLMMAMPGNMDAIHSRAAETMGKEMPVEILRASLPHMNEHQRESLLDFAQRSMVIGGQGGQIVGPNVLG